MPVERAKAQRTLRVLRFHHHHPKPNYCFDSSSVPSLSGTGTHQLFKRLQDESNMRSSLGPRGVNTNLKVQSLTQPVLEPHLNTLAPPRTYWNPLLGLRFVSQSYGMSNDLHSTHSDAGQTFEIFGSPIPHVSVTSVERVSAHHHPRNQKNYFTADLRNCSQQHRNYRIVTVKLRGETGYVF